MTARTPIILGCLAVFALAFAIGGPLDDSDPTAIGWILDHTNRLPALKEASIWVTQAGSAVALLTATTGAAILLATRRRWRDAALLVAVVAGGRLMVDLVKILVERPRPALEPYAVAVSSFSFPSGHAANSMTTLLALALVLPPPHRRGVAIGAAIAASLTIGLTRPMLGVHWPSDVVAGWAFGIAWVAAFAPLLNRCDGTAT